MNEETSKRLKAVLIRKAANDRKELEELQKKKTADLEREQQKKDAKRYWKTSLTQINSAIEEVNKQILKGGMSLRFSVDERDTHPAIARPSIELFEADKNTGKMIVLNVNAFGKLHVVMLIPHTGKGKDCRIRDVSRDYYIEMLVDFLDQTIQPPANLQS